MTEAELRQKAADARRHLEEAAASGNERAKEILAELDGTAKVIKVDPKPLPPPVPHWSEREDG